MAKLRADLLRGIDIAPEKLTVEQYLNAWLKSVELTKSAGTLRIYSGNVKHIIRYLGSYTLQALKAEHIEYMMSELRSAGLAEGTRKTIRATLVTALNQAVEREYITKNVARMVKAPRVRKGKVKAMTEAQLSRLMLAARGYWMAPMIHVGVRLGLRSGETRALLWADINRDDMTIRISGAMKTINRQRVRETTKTEDSECVMPLPPGLLKVFDAGGNNSGRTVGEQATAGTIVASPKLRAMAENPLLLTMMALVLYNKGVLPRDRPQLYERILELLLGQWDKVRDGQSLAEAIGVADWGSERIRPLLDQLSFQAHAGATSAVMPFAPYQWPGSGV